MDCLTEGFMRMKHFKLLCLGFKSLNQAFEMQVSAKFSFSNFVFLR